MEAGVRLWEEPPHAGGVVGIGLPVRGEQVDFLDGADLHADSCVDTAGPAKVTGLGVVKASPVKMGSRTNAKGPAVDRSVWSVGSTASDVRTTRRSPSSTAPSSAGTVTCVPSGRLR